MAFSLAPLQPDPQDEDSPQDDPTQKFGLGLPALSGVELPGQDTTQGGELVEQVLGTSRGLTRDLTGRDRMLAQQESIPTPEEQRELAEERAPALRAQEPRGPVEGFVAGLRRQGIPMMVGAMGGMAEEFVTSMQDAGQDIMELESIDEALPRPEETAEELSKRDDFWESVEEWGRQLRREKGKEIAEFAASDPSNFPGYVGEVVGQMAPLMATAMLGGTVGLRVAGSAAQGAVSRFIAAQIGAFGPVYAAEKSFLQNELEREGLDEDEANFWASLGAVPIAAAESAFESGVLARRVLQGGAEKTIGMGLKRTVAQRLAEIAKTMGAGGAVESATEAIQESFGLSTISIAQGEGLPSMDEIIEASGPAALAGGVGGLFFGGSFGLVGQARDAHRVNVQERVNERARLAAATFDPQEVEEGTKIGEKVAFQDSRGTTRWRGPANQFVSAPTPEEVAEHFGHRVVDEELRGRTEAATDPPEPVDIPVPQAAQEITQAVDEEIEPAVTELNIRNLALNFLGSTRARVRGAEGVTEAEARAEMAELESIALDPELDVTYAERVTAMAKKRAIERVLTQAEATGPQTIDTSLLADSLASMDAETFQGISEMIEASGTEWEQTALREAQLLRQTADQRVESQAEQLRTRLRERLTRNTRGVAVGSRIATETGQVGEVVGVRNSGFAEVMFEGQESPTLLNPADTTVVPEPGQQAQLITGEVVDVLETNNENARVRLPNDSETVVQLNQVERVGADNTVRQELTDLAASQRQAEGVDQRTELIEPSTAVDARTGDRVEVVSLGPNTAELSDGSLVDRADLTFGSERRSVADIQQTGTIPVFEPGTQPSEGRHINFLQIPEELADAFEATVRGGDAGAISGFLNNLPEGAGLFLFPQTQRPGTRLYAVELPSDARTPTDAAKRALGVLSGNVSPKEMNPSTLLARVRLSRDIDPTEVGLMRVPEGLRAAVQNNSVVNSLSGSDLQDYLRRLTDLGFQMDAETGAALGEARQAAQAAADARIEGELGEAEVAEIEAQERRTEAAQAQVEWEVQEKRKIWEEIKGILADEMTAKERSVVEALNATLADDLTELPGVGEATAERIVELKEAQGGSLETVEDLLQVRGIGQATLNQIEEAIRQRNRVVGEIGSGPEDPGTVRLNTIIGAEREARLKALLSSLPGRVGRDASTWKMVLSHPDIPGLKLVIDKESIPTARDGGRLSRAELRAQDPERFEQRAVELPDGTVIERDPLDLLTHEELLDLTSRADVDTRDVYHIEFVDSKGKPIHSRTIGSRAETTVKVPAHLARGRVGLRGQAGTPAAVRFVNEAVSEGRSVDEAVEEMRAERREVRRVHLQGRAQAVVEDPETGRMVPEEELAPEERAEVDASTVTTRHEVFSIVSDQGETLVVEDAQGERFEVPRDQVIEELGTTQEEMLPVSIPSQLSEDAVLGEVVREMREFDKQVSFLAAGEWRSDVPGVYGEIRRSKGGYQAVIFEEPHTRTLQRPRLYTVQNLREFETRAEAETWLSDLNMRPARSQVYAAQKFQTLPPVDQLTPEPTEGTELDDQRWDMHRAHAQLSQILSHYHNKGYVPQPVRDYAVRFALRWNQLGLQSEDGLFATSNPGSGRAVRRMLNIFQPGDLRSAARRRDDAAMPRAAARDVRLENGTIAVDKTTPAERASDVRVMDGILLNPTVEGTHPAALETAKQVYAAEAHRERFYDLADVEGRSPLQDIQDKLVLVGDQRRLGLIVDARLGSNNVTVQIIEEGQPTLNVVPKGDVIRVRNPRKALDYYRAYKDSLGEMTNLPKTPEIGNSPIDRKFGLDLVQDVEAYREGLIKRVADILEHVKLAKDGNITGDNAQVSNLRDAWIRMKELGISNQNPDGGLMIPSDWLMTLNHLAYEEIANTFSTVSPYGEVMAKAKLGQLSVPQERTIREQAEEFGIDTDQPLYRQVEGLMQNVWDPKTAHLLFQMRRDVGALGFVRDYFDGPGEAHGIEIRMPAMGSSSQTNWFASAFTTPREMANRHPTIRVFQRLAEKYRTLHGNRVKNTVDIIRGLQALGSGMNLERKEIIWDLLQDPALGEYMDSPAEVLEMDEITENASDEVLAKLDGQPDSWNWYRQYRVMRQMAVRGRRDNIRNSLIRGFHPEALPGAQDGDPNAALEMMGFMKMDQNLDENQAREIRELIEAGKPVYRLDRRTNAAYSKPRGEVETFLDLIEQYRTLSEVPAEVRTEMEKSKPMPGSETPWMVDEFDFWARYGINNYAPKIMQGNFKVFAKDPQSGEETLIAWAPDGETVQEFIFRARRGQIEGILPSTKFSVEVGRARADDLDMEFLGVKKFARVYAKLASRVEKVDDLGADFMRVVTQELRFGAEPAAPRDLHMQPRVADLSEVIEDPYERMIIYMGRTSRNNFLLDIEHSYETAREIDGNLARANGIDELTSDPVGLEYMRELRDSFMGRKTKRENMFTHLLGMIDSLLSMPNRVTRQLIAKIKGDSNYNPWTDPAFLDTLYNQDYATRRWAENLTALQSVLRLGLNFSGAAINATQHLMFTPSYLVSRGASVTDAIKWSLKGMGDALNYWGNVLPERVGAPIPFSGALAGDDVTRSLSIHNPLRWETKRGSELAEFAEDAGVAVVPARGVAGPGLGITGEASPVFFSDDSLLKRGWKMTEWISMIPFAKAERSVRLSSTFAARRFAQAQGLSKGAAVQLAREVVDNTQFQYYDQALPPFMRGNAARVLFQFQHFPMNAVKFEKDLMMAMFPEGSSALLKNASARAGRVGGKKKLIQPSTGREVSASAQALKAWLLFNASHLTLGGGAWFVARPHLAPLSWIARLLSGQNAEELLINAAGGGEDRYKANPGPVLGDPEMGQARNAVLYGLPGLLNVAISARLGVSGLDYDPTRAADLFLGPTGSLYADTWNVLFGEEAFHRANRPAALMGAVGALAASRTGVAGAPIMGALTMTQLGSLAQGTEFLDWMRGTSQGRQFRRSVAPNIYTGIEKTIDIFGNNGAFNDANFQRRRYPSALNRAFESAVSIAGFQTVRDSEERALLQHLYHTQMDERIKRSIFTSMAATHMAEGDVNSAERIIAESIRQDATINMEDIERILQRRQLGPVERALERGSLYLRTGGRSMPSGRP